MYHENSKKQVQQHKNQINFILKSSGCTKNILNTLIDYSHRNSITEVAQETLATKIGGRRETANRIISQLHKWGIIWKVGIHGHKCKYKVAQFLFLPEIIKTLKGALPALLLGLSAHSNSCQSVKSHTKQFSLFIKSSSSLDLVPQYYSSTRDARERVVEKPSSFNLNKRSGVVSEAKSPPTPKGYGEASAGERPATGIPEYLTKLKSLVLTEAGMVWMSGFTETAGKHADLALLQKATPATDPFRYMFFVANKYSQENGLKRDWALKNRLALELDIDESMPMVASYEHKPKSEKKQSSDNSTQQSKPEPKKLYTQSLYDHYRSKFEVDPGWRDAAILRGDKGTDHRMAYVDARTKIWADLNDTAEKELDRWEKCLTPIVLAALNKLSPDMKAVRLKERDRRMQQLREQIALTKTPDNSSVAKSAPDTEDWTFQESLDHDVAYEEVF